MARNKRLDYFFAVFFFELELADFLVDFLAEPFGAANADCVLWLETLRGPELIRVSFGLRFSKILFCSSSNF